MRYVAACLACSRLVSPVGWCLTLLRLRFRSCFTQLDHTDWFLARVREHVPPSDTLLWSDVATKTNKKFSGGPHITLAITMDVLLLVPSIVWLGIGLPYSIVSRAVWL